MSGTTEENKIMRLDWLTDPGTDARLLPEAMRERDNRRRLRYCKSALGWAMARLKAEQRECIRLHYKEGLSKSEIGRRLKLSDSAVLKILRAGEDKLRVYAGLYMDIYDKLERELLSGEKEDSA